jgi:hypothetical protein
MFVGHYAVGLVLKSKAKKTSLGLLFLAVQFLDLLFFPLVVFGIERLRLIPQYTASTDFALEYMPFSHSLVAAIAWAVLAFFVAKWWVGGLRRPIAIGLAVLSHWFLDLIVHTPDLPLLLDEGPKWGFGLWRYPGLTFVAESALLVAGLTMYMRATHARSRIGQYGMPAFVVALAIADAYNLFGPPPGGTIPALAATALMTFFAFAGVAFWLDRHRG